MSSQRAEVLARHVLIAIRVLMGLMFMACGFTAVFDAFPRPHAALPGDALALGRALVVAGSMLPLLKGVEVLVATMLDLYQTLCASHPRESVEAQAHASASHTTADHASGS